MIIRKDLIDRKYDGKACIGFTVNVEIDDQTIEVVFRRVKTTPFSQSPMLDNKWSMRVVLDRDEYVDSQVFGFSYVVPSNSVPLETVAGIGLRYLQLKMKEEVQLKSQIDFAIGEMLIGMLGEMR